MISVSRPHGNQTVLRLDGGTSMALVDHDWIPTSEGSVCAPYVAADGAVWYRERQLSPEGTDATRRVAAWISSLVDEIVELVDGIAGGGLQVTGQGVTAERVRRRLGVSAITSTTSPLAIVEMTGKSAELQRATESVADGGLIVLGGESDPLVEINLYKDVHRRGLHVLGAPSLGATREPGPDDGRGFPVPVSVRAGHPLPSGQWYRVAC